MNFFYTEKYHQGGGECPMLRTNTKPYQLIKHAKISYSIASLVFRKFSYRTYRNGLNRGISKLKVLRASQKVQTVLVRYLLLGICILVHSCTGSGTWKTGHHFPGWVYNPKLRTRYHKSINSHFLLFAKDMIFGKQKFEVKQPEDEQFYV